MKKYITIILIALSALILVSCQASAEDSNFITRTEVPETHEVFESATIENTIATTNTLETTESSTPETTITEEPITQTTNTDSLITSKTYICCTSYFDDPFFSKHPNSVPALTLKSDGSMIFRINYLQGVTDVLGTYKIEDNHIYIDCTMEGSFFDDGTGYEYMDDKFVFEVVDDDTLTIHAHPDDTGSFNCYAVNAGDPFVRK